MGGDFLNRNFCPGCDILLPPCIVSNEYKSLGLDDIISGIISQDKMEVFTCPVDSQDKIGDYLKINDKCIDCCICFNRCIHTTLPIRDIGIKKPMKLLNSIIHTKLLLSTQFNNLLFYSEVKVVGNSRVKRIDILGVSESYILLIKLITNTSKMEFYIRSYIEIAKYILPLTKDKKVKVILLGLTNDAKVREIDGIQILSINLDQIQKMGV